MRPRYRVTLTLQEHHQLAALTKDGSTNGKRFLYARALLLCDQGPYGPNWTVARVAEALGVATRTIERLKQRFVEEGLTVNGTERCPVFGKIRCPIFCTLKDSNPGGYPEAALPSSSFTGALSIPALRLVLSR